MDSIAGMFDVSIHGCYSLHTRYLKYMIDVECSMFKYIDGIDWMLDI